jgi:hypothetical protein
MGNEEAVVLKPQVLVGRAGRHFWGDAVRPSLRNLGAAPANEGDHWPLRGIRWVQ